MFSARRPVSSVMVRSCRSSPPPIKSGLNSSGDPVWIPAVAGMSGACLFRGAQLRLHLVKQFLDLRAFEPCDIVLILQKHAERVRDGRGIERHDVELGERARPIKRFSDTRSLEQFLLAQR